jgi:hypothetical protein
MKFYLSSRMNLFLHCTKEGGGVELKNHRKCPKNAQNRHNLDREGYNQLILLIKIWWGQRESNP